MKRDPVVGAGLAALAAELTARAAANAKPLPAKATVWQRNRKFTIKPTDTQWRAWMEFLELHENEQAICEAKEAGQIVAQTIWPPSERIAKCS